MGIFHRMTTERKALPIDPLEVHPEFQAQLRVPLEVDEVLGSKLIKLLVEQYFTLDIIE